VLSLLKRDEDDALGTALIFKVEGQRKRGRPRKTWRRHVEKEIREIWVAEGRRP